MTRCAGYVTSAAYSATIGARSPTRGCPPPRGVGDAVAVDYRGPRSPRWSTPNRGGPRDGPDQEVTRHGHGLRRHRRRARRHGQRRGLPPGRRGQRVLGLEKFTPAHDKGPATAVRASSGSPTSRIRPTFRCCCGPTSCGKGWRPTAVREVYRMTGGLFIGPPDCLTVAGSLRAAGVGPAARGARRGGDHGAIPDTSRRSPATSRSTRPRRGSRGPRLTVQAHWSSQGGGRHPAIRRTGARVGRDRGRRSAHHHGHLYRRPAGHLPGRLGAPAARRVRHPDHRRAPGAVLARPASAVPAPFVDQPIFIDENPPGMQVYGFPAIDGPRGGVKVAFFRKGIECTPETIDRTVHDNEIAEMRSGVAGLVPALDGPLPARGHLHVLQHPRSALRDRASPRTCANVTVACGFSGPRLQVRAGGGRDPRRPGHRRGDGPPDLAVRPAEVGDRVTTESHRRHCSPPWRASTTPAPTYSPPSRNTSSRPCGSARCAPRTSSAPGGSRRCRSGRESVLVVRGRDGLLRAFLNVCRHRGAHCAANPRAR